MNTEVSYSILIGSVVVHKDTDREHAFTFYNKVVALGGLFDYRGQISLVSAGVTLKVADLPVERGEV